MTEPGANEELFSLIIVSTLDLIGWIWWCELNNNLFDSGFYDGLGWQDAKRVRRIFH